MYRNEISSGLMYGSCSRAVWPYMWLWGNSPKDGRFRCKRVRHYIIQSMIGGGNPRWIDHRQERLLPKFVHTTPNMDVLESSKVFGPSPSSPVETDTFRTQATRNSKKIACNKQYRTTFRGDRVFRRVWRNGVMPRIRSNSGDDDATY